MKKHILLATLAATAALVVGCGSTASAEKTDAAPAATEEPKPAEGDAAAPAETAPAPAADSGGGW